MYSYKPSGRPCQGDHDWVIVDITTRTEICRRCGEISLESVRPLLTPGVLYAISEAARTFGNDGDHVAVSEFVEWCYQVAGADMPDLDPYKIPEEPEAL